MGTSPKAQPLAQNLSSDKQSASHTNGDILASIEASYSGPIPPPRMLAQYDQITPGLASRLVAHAESEAQHRREMERLIIDAQIEDRKHYYREARCGQICALIITLAALATGSYTALNGHEVAGSVIGIGGIGGIVTTFILGSNRHRPVEQIPTDSEKTTTPKTRKRRK